MLVYLRTSSTAKWELGVCTDAGGTSRHRFGVWEWFPSNLVDASLAFLVLLNVQLDANGGVPYTGAEDHWSSSVGLSFRLPR